MESRSISPTLVNAETALEPKDGQGIGPPLTSTETPLGRRDDHVSHEHVAVPRFDERFGGLASMEAARPGFWTYVREVGRYSLSWTALRTYAYRAAYYVHDHVAPVAQMRCLGNPRIHPTASLRCGHNIELGHNSHINQYCCVWASAAARIVLGDNLLMGPGAKLFASNHGIVLGVPMNQQPWVEKDIVIGHDVWIGANTVIVAGVTVGDGCVIAAGSVVTRDIPPYSVAAGAPARVLKSRR